MTRLSVLAFASTIVWTGSAAAESPAPQNRITLFALPGIDRPIPPAGRPSFAVPSIGYGDPADAGQRPRGIIAGRQVAPGAVLGLGIFQVAPKMRGYVGDVPQNMAPKKTRRAAIGLSMKF